MKTWRHGVLRIAIGVWTCAGRFTDEDRGGPLLGFADEIHRGAECLASGNNEKIAGLVEPPALDDLSDDGRHPGAVTPAVVANVDDQAPICMCIKDLE